MLSRIYTFLGMIAFVVCLFVCNKCNVYILLIFFFFFLIIYSKEKHSLGAGAVISRQPLWPLDRRRLSRAPYKPRKYYRSLFPSSGIIYKRHFRVQIISSTGVRPYCCVGREVNTHLLGMSTGFSSWESFACCSPWHQTRSHQESATRSY